MTAMPLTMSQPLLPPPTPVGAQPGTARPVAALRRQAFAFAADGSHAACLAAAADGRWFVESWRLSGVAAEPVALTPGAGGARSESQRSQLVSLPDGRVLICRHEGERHDLLVRGTGGDADLAAGTLHRAGLRLLPLPASAPGGPVAVALGTDGPGATAVWLVSADGVAAPQQVTALPGRYGGGVWLDRGGRLLALDQLRTDAGAAGGRVKTVVLDLATGRLTQLLELTPESNDRLVAADPLSGLIIVRSDAPGEDRLGWGVLGSSAPLRFPDCLHDGRSFLRPVAVEPHPDPASPIPAAQLRVAVQSDWGAGSSLGVWTPGSGRLEPLEIPAGRLGGVGHWSSAGLRMPFSAPDRPTALATVDVDVLQGRAVRPTPQPVPLRLAPLQGGSAGVRSLLRVMPPPVTDRGWRLDGSATPEGGGRWKPAHTVQLQGAAGPLEGVVYGGEAWLTAERLVMALHGGPADAWRLEFDPTLQRLAAAGVAVVAPNQRGSTGYGVAHAEAVRGAWGGPDLDDVLALLESIGGQRESLGLDRVALFGFSYGAFLALLAACTVPEHVARVAAVAPFLSGARLAAEAGPEVRTAAERLGADQEPPDGRGPRDVLALLDRLAAQLLVVHGVQDDVVPVGQSRLLRQELLRLGRVEGVDFTCVEAAGAGHDVLSGEGAPLWQELLSDFLAGGR
ncbi:alpha/beta hydrolase family protein [Streptacidiphilus monticola]|uniref:Alpha/beta hydrolase family protein n=1 Tax=Streptacidiphilus monticola TaxID=2161674 RepID=A0ABW1FXC2_9ACTN